MTRKQAVLSAAFPGETDSEMRVYSRRGDVYNALAYTDLFWPSLIEVRGAVILGVGQNTREWVEEGVDSIMGLPEARRPPWSDVIERFNWFEVPYLFGFLPDPQEWQDEASYELAGVLCETWSARLRVGAPERVFRVVVNEPQGDGDPHSLNISIKQISPPLRAPNAVGSL